MRGVQSSRKRQAKRDRVRNGPDRKTERRVCETLARIDAMRCIVKTRYGQRHTNYARPVHKAEGDPTPVECATRGAAAVPCEAPEPAPYGWIWPWPCEPTASL